MPYQQHTVSLMMPYQQHINPDDALPTAHRKTMTPYQQHSESLRPHHITKSVIMKSLTILVV